MAHANSIANKKGFPYHSYLNNSFYGHIIMPPFFFYQAFFGKLLFSLLGGKKDQRFDVFRFGEQIIRRCRHDFVAVLYYSFDIFL